MWEDLIASFPTGLQGKVRATIDGLRQRNAVNSVQDLAQLDPAKLAQMIAAVTGDDPTTDRDDDARLKLARKLIDTAKSLPTQSARPLPADVTAMRQLIAGSAGIKQPITRRYIRDIASKVQNTGDGRRLKQFARYSDLFHPYLSASIAARDLDPRTRLDTAALSTLGKELGFGPAQLEWETDKLDALRRRTDGSIPSEVEVLLGRSLPPQEARRLRDAKVFTLEDARQVLLTRNAPRIDGPWSERLRAVAALSAVTPDIRAADRLVARGHGTLTSVAALSADELGQLARDTQVSVERLFAVRNAARAGERFVSNTIAPIYMRYSAKNPPGKPKGGVLRDLVDDPDLIPAGPAADSCQDCDECQSARSLAAYLLDLIAFAGYQFRVTLGDLEGQLHRNFMGLRATCPEDRELVPLALIQSEVLERFLVADNSGLADVPAVQAALLADADTQPAFGAFLDSLRAAWARLIGFDLALFHDLVALLRTPPAAPTPTQKGIIGAGHLALGIPGDDADLLPQNVRDTLVALDDDPLAEVNNPVRLLAVRKAQLQAQAYSLEDELFDGNPPADLAERRAEIYRRLAEDINTEVDAAYDQALPFYQDALLTLAARRSGQNRQALAVTLHMNAVSGCDALTRTQEAVIALQSYIQARLLAGDAVDGTGVATWEDFRTYEAWRGMQLGRFYWELDYIPALYLRSDFRELKAAYHGIIKAINRPSTYNDGGRQIGGQLAQLHNEVWRRFSANFGPPVGGERPDLQRWSRLQNLQARAWSRIEPDAEPLRMLHFTPSEWHVLQNLSLAKIDDGGKEQYEWRITGNATGQRDLVANLVIGSNQVVLHLLAFYILPRLWGLYYYHLQDYERSVQAFHLIYNETCDPKYNGTECDGVSENPSEITDGVVYAHLRRFPDNPTSSGINALNLRDVELKDIKLLLARSYLDWADVQFRFQTDVSRGLARLLYERVLRIFGYAAEEDGSGRPTCESPCQRIAGEIETEILAGFDTADRISTSSILSEFLAQNPDGAEIADLKLELAQIVRNTTPKVAAQQVAQILRTRLLRERPMITVGNLDRRRLNYDMDPRRGAEAERYLLAALPEPDSLGAGPGLPDLPGVPGVPDPLDPADGRFDPPLPDFPFDEPGDFFSSCGNDPEPVPNFIKVRLCVPENPVAVSYRERACLGLRLIRECRNPLGYKNEYVPVYRFGYLLNTVKEIAGLAYNAEQDFVRLTQSAAGAEFELLKELQSLQVNQATVALNNTMVTQAQEQVSLARLQKGQLNTQADQIQKQIDDYWTDEEEQAYGTLKEIQQNQDTLAKVVTWGAAVGVIAAAATSVIATAGTSLPAVVGAAAIGGTTGAAAFSGVAGIISAQIGQKETEVQMAQLRNSVKQRQAELNRSQELLVLDQGIAQQNIAVAQSGARIARQQLGIAQLNAKFAADTVQFLKSRLFNGDRLVWMASIARENYRVLLGYAVTAAWLAERALEFERQRQYHVIRFDYWKDRDQGLMGVDRLRTDLETLANEKLVNETRKHQITRTISLAQIAPLELAQFRQTGQLPLTILEDWFERDFPTHYLRLIKGVTVNLVALVPPTEGVRATLTQLGITRTLERALDGRFRTIEIKRDPERIAISSSIGATGLFTPLLPESQYLNPFEGNGVAGNWLLEMPKSSNPYLNYDDILDVQLVLQYTSLDDPAKKATVPMAAQGAATYSLKLNFADPYYDLHNPIFVEGAAGSPYRITFRTDERFFAPNQRMRRLSAITMYFEQDGAVRRPLTTLRFTPDGSAAHVEFWTQAITSPLGAKRLILNAGAREKARPLSGIWTLEFSNDQTAIDSLSGQDQVAADIFARDAAGQSITRDGHKLLNLEWLKDVMVMLEYDYISPAG